MNSKSSELYLSPNHLWPFDPKMLNFYNVLSIYLYFTEAWYRHETKFDLSFRSYGIFLVSALYDLVTLTFDLWPFVYVVWTNCVLCCWPDAVPQSSGWRPSVGGRLARRRHAGRSAPRSCQRALTGSLPPCVACRHSTSSRAPSARWCASSRRSARFRRSCALAPPTNNINNQQTINNRSLIQLM